MSIVVDKGMRFDYFPQIRNILKAEHGEILVVDPYRDSNFFLIILHRSKVI